MSTSTKIFDKSDLLSQFDEVFESVRAADTRSVPKFFDVKKSPKRVHPWLYLPIEVRARELDAKALIAKEAAEQGFRVVIGAIWLMQAWAPYLPPGIVLFKSVNGLDAKNMEMWSEHGHMIAVLDEEIFGIKCAPEFIAATTHPYVAARADLVCAQGRAYAEAFPYPANVKVTGNARTQTYKPSNGDDILVCLQSGNINNNGRSFADMVKQVLESSMPLTSPEGQGWAAILKSSIAHECDQLPLVLGTIDALAEAFPSRRIVIRAHPVEDPSTWAFDKPNVSFDTRGSIIESLQSAGSLVFVSGCTTGLDAYLAGVPAVRLGTGGHGISADMHTGVSTPEEAVWAVEQAQLWSGSIGEHLAPVGIVPELVRLYRDNPLGGTPSLTKRVRAEPLDFHRRKFPDTSPEEIVARVGRPVKQIAWNTFLI